MADASQQPQTGTIDDKTDINVKINPQDWFKAQDLDKMIASQGRYETKTKKEDNGTWRIFYDVPYANDQNRRGILAYFTPKSRFNIVDNSLPVFYEADDPTYKIAGEPDMIAVHFVISEYATQGYLGRKILPWLRSASFTLPKSASEKIKVGREAYKLVVGDSEKSTRAA